MKIITGQDIDLITPFPSKEVKRIFAWLHCFHSIPITDAFPKTEEELTTRLENEIRIRSFGMIDKHNILGVRHEAPLIGIYTFDQDTPITGNVSFVCTRKAWGSRLVDQAGQVLINHLFETVPELTRLTMMAQAGNGSARALFKGLGFRYEGCLRDAVIVKNTLQNMAIFGITRREWDEQELGKEYVKPILQEDKELVLVN